MIDAGATVVISYSLFRACQDRRRAIAAALRPPERSPTADAYVVHVGPVTGQPRRHEKP